MIFLDFETRARHVDLRQVGGDVYTAAPSTEVNCLVALWVPDDGARGEIHVWTPSEAPLGDFTAGAVPRRGGHAPWPQVEDALVHEPHQGPEPPAALLELAQRERLVAHNAEGFDRLVWERSGLPPPLAWLDSFPRALRAALPGSLEGLAQALYGVGKDQAGHRVMLLSTAPPRAAWCPRCRGPAGPQPGCLGCAFLEPDGPRLTSLVHYCLRDVLLLACAWRDAELGAAHVDDGALAASDACNRRGIAVDAAACRALEELQGALEEEAEDRARAASDGAVTPTALHSPAALLAWIRGQAAEWLAHAEAAGADGPEDAAPEVEDVTAETVDRLIVAGPPAHVRTVLEARQVVAHVTVGKARAALTRLGPGGRLRYSLAYHGAHTGRWAGRGFQPHNLPRVVVDDRDQPVDPAPWLDRLLALTQGPEARSPRGAAALLREEMTAALGARFDAANVASITPRVLASMLRATLVAAPGCWLAAVDYASIEARGLLWLAGDEVGLQVYREGQDPYRTLAASVYGVGYAEVSRPQRQVAKVLVLACGFQAGPDALIRYAAKMGVDLATAGRTPAQLVEGWRDANPRVAGARVAGRVWTTPDGREVTIRNGGLWRDTEAAVRRVVQGGAPETVGRCTWHRPPSTPDLLCRLPSGRELRYRQARVEDLPSRWDPTTLRAQVTYLHKGESRRATFGGCTVENLTQAICRDLLADALVRLEAAGLPVALHVHDEAVCEVEREADLARVEAIMGEAPAWAAGLPIKVEGHVGRRYGK